VIQLVTDFHRRDPALAAVAERVALVAGDADIEVTCVPRSDTLAAGCCVARLALSPGPPGRLVVLDVAAPPGARFCAGRADGAVAVIGANVGWAWSFAAARVDGPYYLEVPAGDRSPVLVAEAVVRVARRQPHAVRGRVPPEQIAPLPDAVVAFADADGTLQTTIRQAPAAPGSRMRVRIGSVCETARVRSAPEAGELALLAGGAGFQALAVGGGSAAALFGMPPGGERIVLEPAGA
jgi:hypothetical protein